MYSILSCTDLYKIIDCLAACLNRSDLLFGGMNMIFAGDFAQLPPVISRENSALYSPAHDMYASSKRTQNAALGKAIWHQVTTVVILQQNMHQSTQSEGDSKLRTALANMRYKACTKNDIAFLNLHVCKLSDSAPDITSQKYRNVSIITDLNIHKDAFNQLGTIRLFRKQIKSLLIFSLMIIYPSLLILSM
ncbi:hypothetical protein ARMGADRAFT_927977 [Armillaria gallica]|uniref:ATP-dependent DNA helicase n=1 Tax=Armillaria gallica TaxID=47427 RepID=A0A2H3DGP2_ARMGA|nr:hypothetical protein ARMGADRAFT_927977 [Armillaria gallica]